MINERARPHKRPNDTQYTIGILYILRSLEGSLSDSTRVFFERERRIIMSGAEKMKRPKIVPRAIEWLFFFFFFPFLRFVTQARRWLSGKVYIAVNDAREIQRPLYNIHKAHYIRARD